MSGTNGNPPLARDLSALRDLYLTWLWMMGSRLPLRPGKPKHLPLIDPVLLEELEKPRELAVDAER